MMENIDQFWEDDDGERMRKASNAYDDVTGIEKCSKSGNQSAT